MGSAKCAQSFEAISGFIRPNITYGVLRPKSEIDVITLMKYIEKRGEK
jgi:hypothetical protein